MCSIFLSLVAIMFESGQFYEFDPSTGLSKLSDDPTTVSFYTIVLVMGAITLVGSILYYLTVLISEMFGCMPRWLRILCAHKLSAINRKHLQREEIRDSFDDGVFEMAPVENTAFANPLQDLEEARKANSEAAEKNKRLLEMHEQDMKQQAEILENLRKLKQKANTKKPLRLLKKKKKRPSKRNSFAPKRVAAVAEKT